MSRRSAPPPRRTDIPDLGGTYTNGTHRSKFGGSSVADADRIRNVARIITETYRRGHRVVAVLSAQGDTTDDLIAKAAEINPNASKRDGGLIESHGTGRATTYLLSARVYRETGHALGYVRQKGNR